MNEGKLYSGATMVPERAALLQLWVDAGFPLGNHTYSHIDINSVPLEKYQDMVSWFETVARDTFGRDIPQILLTHTNELHTDALDALLTRIEQRGYRWVTLGEAMKDAAYATPDEYVGTSGPSWLHRWRVGKNLTSRLPEEPDPPQWVVDLSK